MVHRQAGQTRGRTQFEGPKTPEDTALREDWDVLGSGLSEDSGRNEGSVRLGMLGAHRRGRFL